MDSINEQLLIEVVSSRSYMFKEVETLIDCGADIDYQKPKEMATSMIKEGSTALMIATVGNNSALVELLLTKKADISLKDIYRREAIHYANDKTILSDLIRHGSNVNARDCHGNSPMHIVLMSRNVKLDVIRLLVEEGADVTAKNNRGDSPLSIINNVLYSGWIPEDVKHLVTGNHEEKILLESIDSNEQIDTMTF